MIDLNTVAKKEPTAHRGRTELECRSDERDPPEKAASNLEGGAERPHQFTRLRKKSLQQKSVVSLGFNNSRTNLSSIAHFDEPPGQQLSLSDLNNYNDKKRPQGLAKPTYVIQRQHVRQAPYEN